MSTDTLTVAWTAWPDDVDDDAQLFWMGGDPRTLDGQRVEWDEYRAAFVESVHPYLDAVRASIIEKEIRGDGSWHQEDPEGTPVFSDGKVLGLSMRAWGDLMAAIWTTEDDKQYSYMDFYCCGAGPFG